MTDALADIAAERQRQIDSEGWTPAHDDEHTEGEMAEAAACYAGGSGIGWPWHPKWWKPSDKRRDLVKAGALIIAEIERLDRASNPDEEGKANERCPVCDGPTLANGVVCSFGCASGKLAASNTKGETNHG